MVYIVLLCMHLHLEFVEHNLPVQASIIHYAKQGSGIPNITGGMSPTGLAGVSASYGAFYDELNNTTDYQAATRGGYGVRWGFNASRSSSVYQNDLTEARPVNYAVNYFIKY